MPGELQLAAAGDAMITRPWSQFDGNGIDTLVSALRDADVSMVNLETLFHDFEGYPEKTGSGVKMRSDSTIADELNWAGFNLFATATNHAMDYSYEGMKSTMEALEERNLTYAGMGMNLADARSPGYVDTPAGRVALVSACSTVVPGSEAGKQRSDMNGRPGISPLPLQTKHVVTEEQLNSLKDISETIGMENLKRRYDQWGGIESRYSGTIDDEDVLRFLGLGVGGPSHQRFEVGENPGIYQEVVQEDCKEILEQISVARRTADWVVVSLHAHEGENGQLNVETVAPFVETFARNTIDAGADVFVGHGPHRLRGIEIYDDAPIFYSLGNLFAEVETTPRLPAELYDWYDLDGEANPIDIYQRWGFDENGDRIGFLKNRAYWDSVVPICFVGAEGVREIELYPIELGYERDRPSRGTPELARSDDAERVINRLAKLSEPYGTEVEFENGLGSVSL